MTQSSDAIVPLGAIRFNSDSQKLEYWNGSAWFQIHTFSPNYDGGVRGFFLGGGDPAPTNRIDFITISTQGNAQDFGDLTQTRMEGAALSNSTRALAAGDSVPGSNDEIDVFTMSSTGNASDFGNLLSATNNAQGFGALANATRGIFGGGYQVSPGGGQNILQYVTIDTNGNAVDFGDLDGSNYSGVVGGSSPTRGLWIGGGPGTNTIQFVTIASTGNAHDFGDSTAAESNGTTGSNSVRIIHFFSGDNNNTIEFVTTATLGNAIDFGDLIIDNHYSATSCSSPTRACVGGGNMPARTNLIEYVQIMTQGDAVDFGDLVDDRYLLLKGCVSTGHGGLG